MKRVKGRNDVIRDDGTNAILYKTNSKTKLKNEIIGLKKELNTVKNDLESIKTLLERLIDGR
jgi:hypothetical protein